MADLVAILAGAGCAEVRTYIQSGNAVFRASAACARALPEAVAGAIEKRLGFRAPVVLRRADELRAAARANPLLARGIDPATLHLVFLADRPAPARAAALDPARSSPDRFEL